MSAGDFFSLLLSIGGMVLVLYLCYKFSKYLAKKVNTVSGSDNIKIIERTALGQDKGLAVVLICGKYYLIGYANNDIEILKELDNYTPPLNEKDSLQESNNVFVRFLNDNKRFYSGVKDVFTSKKSDKGFKVSLSSAMKNESRKTENNEADKNDL